MLLAIGWAIVRSSRDAYADISADMPNGLALLDDLDDRVRAADDALFQDLKHFLAASVIPDLFWHFIPYMNNHSGILHLSSSRNHRGARPKAVAVLDWLASRGTGSYGLVYVHDDEEAERSNEFRVWRLRRGVVDELQDPFLSPITPSLDLVRF